MSVINIQRNSEYNNRFRNFQIIIDGQIAGTLANGESKTFVTTPGQHSVAAKIDWCSSPEIILMLSENETRELKLSGFKHGNWLMPLAGMVLAAHFILNIFFNSNFLLFAVLPVFILLVYYLTTGRKKYLALTEC